jgi:hypothetical protein
MKSNITFINEKIIKKVKQKGTSQLFKACLLIVLAVSMWQCKKDDFKGETWGFCPEVVYTDPAGGATFVVTSKIITATFNTTMDPTTINETTFLVYQGINQVTGTVSYTGKTARFIPDSYLAVNTEYDATITIGAKDPYKNALVANYDWSFTTGNTSSSNQPPSDTVHLRTAWDFVILAGAGVTNTGLTVIKGDVGTSPTGTINGFGLGEGTIVGETHAADPVADQAKLDLTTAFNDAQARSTGAVSLPGNLSGLTLTPGLYVNSSSVMLSAGSVTLDAKGNPDAVFIFKMGSSLTTSPGTQIILAGGAQAKYIYWSVGSSATLGTNSTFNGNILADQSISLNTGAVLNGRALTRVGTVTLQSNTVNRP